MLRCMHALVKIQARVRARRVIMSTEGQAVQEMLEARCSKLDLLKEAEILADAMGLGKTVMTIVLILQKSRRGKSDCQDIVMQDQNDSWEEPNRASKKEASSCIKGGTLIVCPMALLGQRKDMLESHSKPDSVSVFVHYGGDEQMIRKKLQNIM